MHETERHRIILSAVQEKPVVTVQELVDLTSSSEATIRRDIAALHVDKRLRRVRGGAEAMSPPQVIGLAGRPFSVNETLNAGQKRAIARAAVDLCKDGEPIIINGGTTTYQMVHFLAGRRMPIFTNSFGVGWYGNDRTIVSCPMRKDPPMHFSNAFHFGMNSAGAVLGTGGLETQINPPAPWGNDQGGLKYVKVRNPTEKMLLADATDYAIFRFHWLNPPVIGGVIYPHTRGLNILYIDGHAAWYPGPLPPGLTNQPAPLPF